MSNDWLMAVGAPEHLAAGQLPRNTLALLSGLNVQRTVIQNKERRLRKRKPLEVRGVPHRCTQPSQAIES